MATERTAQNVIDDIDTVNTQINTLVSAANGGVDTKELDVSITRSKRLELLMKRLDQLQKELRMIPAEATVTMIEDHEVVLT